MKKVSKQKEKTTIKADAKKVLDDVKKSVKNTAGVVKKDLEGKVDQIKETTKKEAKEITNGLADLWKKYSTEERIYALLGILFLIIGLYYLHQMIVGLVFITLGLLFVTGYFIKREY